MTTRVGTFEPVYNARGFITGISVELWHDGLKKHRVIKGSDDYIVRRKAALQVEEWDDKWAQIENRDRDRRERDGQKRQQEANRQFASERSAEALAEIERLRGVLRYTLDKNDAIDWDTLKDSSDFPEMRPRPMLPFKPSLQTAPREPRADDAAYQPAFGFLDQFMASRRERKITDYRIMFENDHEKWERENRSVNDANNLVQDRCQESVRRAEQDYQVELAAWEQRRTDFLSEQSDRNLAVDAQQVAYIAGSQEAIIEYCDMVLSKSEYPEYFPQEFSLDYNPANKILVVDYLLPAPVAIPTVKEVRYAANKDAFTEQYLSQVEISRLYDSLIYQVTLRTVHEIFEADVAGYVEAIVFNGIVTSIDRTTGKQVTACILSLQAKRSEFLEINLSDVDPKACFRALKGVGSSSLHSLAAVPPIMQVRREDGRFVSAYEVANTLDDSYNLAAMDWEDFEHLIRELFEKEFMSNGGEVRVTQASRDGGVDAVAFDPDPIRGGKIVIQAKRYTNTVGVGAVRDLYGTVMNEGANKGILVTTSDFGPDSYSFAKDKPLTLLSGANLLHMLEKHGYKARINLREARLAANNQPPTSQR